MFQVPTTCSSCYRFFCLKHVTLTCPDCDETGRQQMPAVRPGLRVRIPPPRLLVSPPRPRLQIATVQMPAPAIPTAAPVVQMAAPSVQMAAPAVQMAGPGEISPTGQIVFNFPSWPQQHQHHQAAGIQFMLPPIQIHSSPQLNTPSPVTGNSSASDSTSATEPVSRRSVFASIGNTTPLSRAQAERENAEPSLQNHTPQAAGLSSKQAREGPAPASKRLRLEQVSENQDARYTLFWSLMQKCLAQSYSGTVELVYFRQFLTREEKSNPFVDGEIDRLLKKLVRDNKILVVDSRIHIC